MQISREDAETLKLTGLLQEKNGSDVEALLRPVAESFAEDIQRTLSLYGAIASEDGIRNIYLTGGGAKLSGLTSVMGERLGVPVELAEPCRNFRLNKHVDKAALTELAPLLGVAVGLSVRRIGDK
jgi:type IV pilus assembly protein PilM